MGASDGYNAAGRFFLFREIPVANEITSIVSVEYDDGTSSSFTLGGNTKTRSQSSVRFNRARVSVGTSEEAIPLGEVGTIGGIWIKNLDSTNYVQIRTGTAGTAFARINALEEYYIPIGSGVTAPYIIADTASCECDIVVFAR